MRRSGTVWGSLTTGLRRVEGAALGWCSTRAPVVSYINYVVPGRPGDADNASFQAFTLGDHLVVMVAYDEQDLSAPVSVHADLDGNGLITNVWSIENAPGLCAIM